MLSHRCRTRNATRQALVEYVRSIFFDRSSHIAGIENTIIARVLPPRCDGHFTSSTCCVTSSPPPVHRGTVLEPKHFVFVACARTTNDHRCYGSSTLMNVNAIILRIFSLYSPMVFFRFYYYELSVASCISHCAVYLNFKFV